MNHFNLILPFGIAPSTLVKDMSRQLAMPALEQLLSLTTSREITHFEEYARLLPHESLLSGAISLENLVTPTVVGNKNQNQNEAENEAENEVGNEDASRLSSPAMTHNRMQSLGLLPQEGFWLTMNPVHIHIASDHLVLTDQRRLSMSKEEALILFEAAKEICTEANKTLIYGDEKNWFLRADDWHALQTASIDAASGHNIDIWIAEGDKAKQWRQLQNEIQMLWHINPVNEKREERGEALINSVWLHSGSHQINTNALTLAATHPTQLVDIEQYSVNTNLLIDDMSEAAINSDWQTWFIQMQQLDKVVFAPLLQSLQIGKIDVIHLIATDSHRIVNLKLQRRASWKFWLKFSQKPSLAPLFILE